MTPVLLLAVVLGAGEIPIADAAARFPDPTSWPGAGLQRAQNMLSAVRESQGNQLATRGPGPHQLAARWRAGSLNAAERVSVLLGAPVFHDPAILPAYAEALRSPVIRERQAAAVGLAWLIGIPPPDPTELAAAPDGVWERQQSLADALVVATAEQPLIRMWIDTILVAKNAGRTSASLTLRTGVGTALAAIREIAQPEDVNELVALWPILDSSEQQLMVNTLEMITLQQFFLSPPSGPRTPSGVAPYLLARERANSWVGSICSEIDGPMAVISTVRQLAARMTQDPDPVSGLLVLLNQDYEPLWVVPSQLLVPFGAPAVQYDRHSKINPRNKELRSRVRKDFWVSRFAAEPQRRARDRRPTRPSQRR